MIERHQDYVLSGITIGAFATASYVVRLDPDAPFALRCILSSGMPTSAGQALFQITITGQDDRRYFGGNATTPLTGADSLINYTATLPFIVYPQIPFATQITIQVTVTDLSGSGITNGILVFRGTKLYQEGVVFGPQYPPAFSELMFRYAYSLTIPQGTGGSPSELLSQPLDIQSDADFVLRMCSAANTAGDGYDPTHTFAIVRDQYGKAYSNSWVPIEALFPQTMEPYTTIYPEIYLAKNTQLLLDLQRTSGTQNDTIIVVLHGSKIYASS